MTSAEVKRVALRLQGKPTEMKCRIMDTSMSGKLHTGPMQDERDQECTVSLIFENYPLMTARKTCSLFTREHYSRYGLALLLFREEMTEVVNSGVKLTLEVAGCPNKLCSRVPGAFQSG